MEIPRNASGGRARLVTIFGGLTEDGRRRVHYIFDTGELDYFGLSLDGERPIASLCAQYPGASWYERELNDRYGILPAGTPDARPILDHTNSVGNGGYRFLKVEGDGVCEVPVGPVHAGVIEPGHFRFSVVGDTVLNLELRHFYTHKGTETLFEGQRPDTAVRLAESVSGDNCFAHAVAFCHAVEDACGIEAPERAAWLRVIGLEFERLLAHVGDFGALCNDVAFTVPAARCAAIKERLLRASASFIGTRWWRGVTVPGGVRAEPGSAEAFAREVGDAARQFDELAARVREVPSLENRFDSAGVLHRQVAADFGVVGYVARGSGLDLDVRRDHPYGAYRRLSVKVPVYRYGDVMARARVRVAEAAESARLIAGELACPIAGPSLARFVDPARARGRSAVESPRGELLYYVEMVEDRVARCHVRSPSFQNWPALPFAVAGNVIADFPLINKSFNLSYSGCDR